MRGRFQSLLLVVCFVLFSLVIVCNQIEAEIVITQRLEYAKELHRHNLKDRAKEVFIDILYDTKSSDTDKADTLYWLGQISFEEGRYTVALDDWSKLIKEYTQSLQAKEIKERLIQLQEITEKISDAEVSSVVARSYLNNGDFWSDIDEKFTIDSSWLPKKEMAIQWYEKVIKEFPNSNAALIAYQRKLFTLLDWEFETTGHGLSSNFNEYMPQVLETFADFEKAFPNSSYLQGFRYQIAQAYWKIRDWENTREWLKKVIDSGNGEQTFYTETAKARLLKVEY